MNLSKLNDYIRDTRDTPFQWGVHDCLVFTNNAWYQMYGHGWADDWFGRYMKDGKPLSRQELQKEFGYQSFTQAVDDRLTRVTGVPPKGALVTTRKARRWAIGSALGLSLGVKAVFVSSNGLITHPIETIDKAWVEA